MSYPKHSSELQRISEIEAPKVVPQNGQKRKNNRSFCWISTSPFRVRTHIWPGRICDFVAICMVQGNASFRNFIIGWNRILFNLGLGVVGFQKKHQKSIKHIKTNWYGPTNVSFAHPYLQLLYCHFRPGHCCTRLYIRAQTFLIASYRPWDFWQSAHSYMNFIPNFIDP